MANKEWYVFMMDEVTGPFGENVITQMLKQNRVQFTDFGWTKGMKKWTRFTEVEAFAELMPPAPSVPIPDAGKAADAAPAAVPAGKVVPIRTNAQAAQPATSAPATHGNAAVASAPAKASAQPKVAPAPVIVEETAPDANADAGEKKPKKRMWRVPIDATCTMQGSEFKVLDISEGGVLVECRSSDALEIGTDLKLRIASPSFPKPLDMTGVLVREEDFDGKRCYGVEFTKVNPAHKRTLSSYVANKLQLDE